MPAARQRLRDLGHVVGCFSPGARNALVDVPGVRVGHATLSLDEPVVRSGVTAILPHGGNVYAEKVLGACHTVNGYGKPAGLSQLAELGTIESPILLTSTLSVGPVWEGGLRHVLDANPEAGRAGTVNVIVAECFDGWLSDARGLHVRPEHALAAIEAAGEDDAAEGSVGAGTGTTCFGFKAGVGTSSRVSGSEPGHALGALALANYGRRGDLHLLTGADPGPSEGEDPHGSVVVVLATDAPLSERQLGRLAKRAPFGLGRAGSFAAHPSGEYVLAFSTAHRLGADGDMELKFLRDDGTAMRDLFEMAGEVTQEAVLNSLCVADAMEGRDGHRAEAFPHELLSQALGPPR
jgi:D-aminopeptidase